MGGGGDVAFWVVKDEEEEEEDGEGEEEGDMDTREDEKDGSSEEMVVWDCESSSLTTDTEEEDATEDATAGGKMKLGMWLEASEGGEKDILESSTVIMRMVFIEWGTCNVRWCARAEDSAL